MNPARQDLPLAVLRARAPVWGIIRLPRRDSVCRARLVAVVAAVPMLFLTACSEASGDPGAGETAQVQTSSATPTPTPSPTQSAKYKPASAEGPAENVPLPVMPEEAKEQSKEGLETFARYWYEAANYGYETGDVGLVQAVSSPDCTACLNYYDVVARGFVDDDWMANSAIEVVDVHSDYVLTPEGRYQALVHFRQQAMEYYGPEGLQAMGEADAAVAQLVEAAWDRDQWAVSALVTIKG